MTENRLLRKHKDLIPNQNWSGAKASYWFFCKKHGEYEQRFNNHRGCPRCSYKRTGVSNSLTIKEAEQRHKDLVKGQVWRGVRANYKFSCKKHGEYTQNYNNHNKGARCRLCAHELCSRVKSVGINEAERRHEDLIKGQTWINGKSSYLYLCLKHGEYQQSFSAHDSGQGCRQCFLERVSKSNSLTIQEVEHRHPDLIRGQKWIFASSRYWYFCTKHGKYKQRFVDHGRSGCPKCRASKGEKAIAKLLEDAKIIYEFQKKFDSCKDRLSLPFDFYIPDRRLLIEYHGEQHYRSVKYFGGTQAYRSRLKRDNIKRRWARFNGFKLIVIKYTQNIEEVLQAYLF